MRERDLEIRQKELEDSAVNKKDMEDEILSPDLPQGTSNRGVDISHEL